MDDASAAADCHPATPCWGSTGPTTVHRSKFDWIGNTKHPDGSYWVEEGGSDERPTYCPGQSIPIRYYVHSDHNGAFRWEAQQAEPGQEQEDQFQPITEFISVNNYVKDGQNLANYFMAEGTLGTTQIPNGYCKDGSAWSPQHDQCMNYMFAETTLDLPTNMPTGNVVLRWRWHGSTATDGSVVTNGNAEKSLFINCKDVVIGSPEVCMARAQNLTMV
jgi:hypothetical protein